MLGCVYDKPRAGVGDVAGVTAGAVGWWRRLAALLLDPNDGSGRCSGATDIRRPGDPHADSVRVVPSHGHEKIDRSYGAAGESAIGEPKRMTLPSGSTTAPSCIPQSVSTG